LTPLRQKLSVGSGGCPSEMSIEGCPSEATR
jgi:hypothetical protein